MKKPCHIVFTTIHHPAILRDLYENIHRHGHLEEVKVWVVGDRKTPSSAAALAAEISALGLETVYFGVDEQDAWGKPIRPLPSDSLQHGRQKSVRLPARAGRRLRAAHLH